MERHQRSYMPLRNLKKTRVAEALKGEEVVSEGIQIPGHCGYENL